MTGIAIVGAGIHPFGRHDGVSGLAMGVHAVRAALADAGLAWGDVQVAFGGSEDAGNADTMVADLGPTGHPVRQRPQRLRDRRLVARRGGARARGGAADVALVVGFDKHPRGAFQNDPADWSLPDWYGRIGLMVTTQFFGAKLQRYMHDHAIPQETLAQVAAKAFANGSLTPHAWRRRPLSVDEILASPMLAHPLTQYMLCSPGEGAAALVLCRERVPAPAPRGAAGVAPLGGLPHAPRGHVRGLQPLAPARDHALADGRRGAGGVRDGRASHPATSTSCRCRTRSRERS